MPNHSQPGGDELMWLDLGEATRKVTADSTVTAIIATSTSPLPMLAWCVLSLILRSSRDGLLQGIIVAINGPQGDTREQDAKQAFLDDLMKCVPLTVSRVYGPIGHGEAIDSAIPWVRTRAYLLVHDDAMLLSSHWEVVARNALGHQDLAMVATPGVFGIGGHRPAILVSGFTVCERDDRAGESHIVFPHVNTVFTLCRKDVLAPIGRRWEGFSIDSAGQPVIGETELHNLALNQA